MTTTVKFTYRPLTNFKSEIRLLSYQDIPAENTELKDVQFDLNTYSLENAPEYVALSYVWGDGKADQSLTVNGSVLLIRESLASFLKVFVQLQPRRRIWVDAICISQDDNREKSAQVSFMHRIYQQASEVLIWLGNTTPLLSHAFDSLQKICAAGIPQTLPNTSDIFELKSNQPLDVRSCFNNYTREALSNLVLNPWFERVWVIQECFFTKNATLCCGDMRLPWTTFWGATMTILKQENYTSWPAEELDQQLAHIPFVMTYSRRVMYIVRETWHHVQTSEITRQNSLFTLLSGLFSAQTATHTSTDPRDRVLALLNMAADVDELGLVPDYGKSCAQTYEDLCAAYIKRGYYEILCYSNGRHSDLRMPSWAIDWTKAVPRPLRPNELTIELPTSTFRFCARGSTEPQSHSSAHFPISNGKGVLACRSHTVDLVRHSWVLGTLDFSDCGAFARSIAPLAQWMASVLIRGRVYGHERCARGWIEAGYFTAIAGQTCVDEIAEKAEMKYSHEFVDALQLHKSIKADEIEELPEWVCESEFLASLRDHRALFITETGLCGLGSKDVKKADEVHVIVGCDMPMVLRRRDDKKSGGTFMLVGESYVHGLMYGEALKRSRDVEDIEII